MRVLVIEDDDDGRRSVVEAIEDAGHETVAARNGAEGLDRFRRETFDVVLSDLVMPGSDGIEVMNQIRRVNDQVPVLIMTAYGSVETAVRALKSGAYDYIVKPLDLDDLQAKIARAAETRRLRAEVSSLQNVVRNRYSLKSMVAASGPMQAVLEQVRAVAGTTATVLILGESGTGKELIARALHVEGRRAAGPFVAVNCGAFAETLLESELFGHEKGSFTGAVSRHIGAFERADGGTLFLDEIGIAPKSVQARLLRAIEEREVLRVGGHDPIKVDARIVAASNRDLDEMVEEGEFRHDLLYRLKVVAIRLPPLRERKADIRPLADRFVTTACVEHGRHIETVLPEYYDGLERHDWPGNVRELRNIVESSVIMAAGPSLGAKDLHIEPGRAAPGARAEFDSAAALPGTTLAEMEKQAMLRSLQRHDGNRTLAAEELGVSVRTVQRKIKEHGLPF